MAAKDAQVLELAGREVRITSPDKVLFAERGETKLDLVRYYAAVAEPLMRTMGGRPVLHAALPAGRRRPVVLPEARARQRAGVAGDDDGPDRQRHAVAGAGGRRRRARRLGGQPRLPRLPRLAAPRRRPRARRRAAPGPRPAARHRASPRRARPPGSSRRCSTSSASPAFPRRPATAACTSTSACSRAGTPTRCAPPRSPSRASSSAAAPTSSPPPGGRRSAASGSSSTTTRTRRTRPSSARGRSARARARRSRRRCAGTSSTTSHPDELTLATVPGRLRARRRPVGRDRRRAAVARAAARDARARPRERPARRAVAAGLPEAARRAAARRAEPRPASVAGSWCVPARGPISGWRFRRTRRQLGAAVPPLLRRKQAPGDVMNAHVPVRGLLPCEAVAGESSTSTTWKLCASSWRTWAGGVMK